jgi:hypothetical protein
MQLQPTALLSATNAAVKISNLFIFAISVLGGCSRILVGCSDASAKQHYNTPRVLQTHHVYFFQPEKFIHLPHVENMLHFPQPP